MLLLLLFSLLVAVEVQEKAVALPSPSCPKSCGDVDIEYPFGIGAECAMEGFQLNCSKTGVPLFFDEIPVRDILLPQGQVRAMKHVSTMTRGSGEDPDIYGKDLSGTPFTYSGTSNHFMVVGAANTIAYIADNNFLVGCATQCSPNNHLKAQDGQSYCKCQAKLGGNMSNDYVYFNEVKNDTKRYTNRTAGGSADSYAVIMEAAAFGFNASLPNMTAFLEAAESRINKSDPYGGRVPVILNWVVGNGTCDVASRNKSSYACISNNHVCVDSNSSNGPGYLCNCKKGYSGNPYLPDPDGCKDTDECVVQNPPPCPGRCINIPGDFYCPPISYPRIVGLVVGPTIAGLIVVIAITCTFLVRERKKLANIKQKYFQQHGGMLLLQGISLKQGTAFSVFTEAELIEATNKFEEKNILGRGGHGTVYKGILKDGSLIAVKKCVSMTSEQQKKEFGKEMLILSQINHKNIVKLLGCCLEVEVPMLVYEFIPNGTLFHFIHGDNGCHNIPFSTRIHIAHESAQALAYLHSWASPPILHGDVKSSNILLDKNYVAKVSDFGASILAPTDESQFVTLVQGTCGYLDPEYMQTCQLTDKSDVYSFGVVILELLTGKKAFKLDGPENERSLSQHFLSTMKEDRLMDIIDDRIKSDSNIGLLEEVAELARQCLEMVGERRPSMRDVAEKLERLSKVMQHPWVPVQYDPEEMESLLGESSVANLEMICTGNFSMEKRIVQGLLESGR
ncbi:hypothetical protein EJB05_46004 [Eragrostis curvula]|uniref:Protein kinase domain-containing protein n=1 Tax=Eragrostis curvula TaxID=38414 RepID=A0A5J9TLT1_9POAL|nr:hypothetical protein EJB05_46004 [Eragrostis curvula]